MATEEQKRISVQETNWLDISIPPSMVAEFKQMAVRAISTWQDCSPEMRDFYDRLLGKEHIMGYNMKESLRPKAVTVVSEEKKICYNHPETCNCPVHCK